MNATFGVWCGVLILTTGIAVAERDKKQTPNTTINPRAAEIIGKVKPVPTPANGQQGTLPPGQGPNDKIPPSANGHNPNSPRGQDPNQPRQRPSEGQPGNFPPGQGPNNRVPPPAKIPSGVQNQPTIPSLVPDSVKDAANHSDAVRAAAEARETIESIRQVQGGIDLGILDADAARNRPDGLDPSTLGMQPDDMEAASLIEQIQKVTGGSNHDGWSDTTQAYADSAGLTPNLGAIGAGRARAGGVSVGGGEVGQVKTVTHEDGSTTETYHRGPRTDGVYTDETVERNQDGTMKSQTIVDHQGGGWVETRTATLLPSGQWENTRQTHNASGHGRETERWVGPAPHVSADPDHPYGHGSGWLPGKAPKSVLEKAKDSHTPGGRPPPPDDQGGGGQGGVAGPRVNLDVDLVGQPNPDSAAGGSAVGRMIKNPNDDTVDPPPPVR